MKRTVHVVGRNGVAYDVSLTAQQAAFFMTLAEVKTALGQETTFNDLVIRQVEGRARPANAQSR